MYNIEFTDKVLKELEHRLTSTRDTKIYRRLLCLKLKRLGYNHSEIKDMLGVSPTMITEWLKLFMEHGFEGFCTLQYEGRRISKLEPYKKKIKKHIEEEMVPTLGALQYWLKETLGIEVEQSWLSRWLKKNSLFLTKRQCESQVKHLT